MENEVTVSGNYGLVNIEDYAMSADALVKQVGLIQDVMSKVMKDGEHYGVIPGTKKPTLLKPGAEKLCLLFRFNPNYEILMQDREEYFISYTIKCNLTHIPTGQMVASGVGSCNSRETKYRYRYTEESTGKTIPKEYWNAQKSGDSKEMKRILGGEGFRAAKIDGAWVVARSERVENDNPYDLDNTLLKMACKRALVAATLNATAASDIFTQDIEDMEGFGNKNGRPRQEKKATDSVKKKSTTQATGGKSMTPKEQLQKELLEYCGEDPEVQKATLKQISFFEAEDGGKWIEDIDKASDKWVNSSIGKLRKLEKKPEGNTEFPENCPKNANECEHSGWIDGKVFCGGETVECPFGDK